MQCTADRDVEKFDRRFRIVFDILCVIIRVYNTTRILNSNITYLRVRSVTVIIDRGIAARAITIRGILSDIYYKCRYLYATRAHWLPVAVVRDFAYIDNNARQLS